jgi:hypothetical protein
LQDDRGPDLAAAMVAFLDRTVGSTLSREEGGRP